MNVDYAVEELERMARFEEGVHADPTVNMSEEDAAKWKAMNEEHGDKFKTADLLTGLAKMAVGDIPADVERYVKETKESNPDYDDAKVWAVAWSRYCKYKQPGSEHCHMNTNDYFKKAEAELTKLAAGRPLYEIAREIRKDWGPKVNYAAKPYLDAMGDLDSINDDYGQDSGSSIVAYFLSNATSWRGETAKRIKAELNAMLKGSRKWASDPEMQSLITACGDIGPIADMEYLAEGCPDNLEGADCDKWEANTEKYKDVVKDQHQAALEELAGLVNDPVMHEPDNSMRKNPMDPLATWDEGKIDLKDDPKDHDSEGSMIPGMEDRLASDGDFTFAEAELGLLAEGCPDNLDGSECKEWESNTEKYKDVVKDQHKTAAPIVLMPASIRSKIPPLGAQDGTPNPIAWVKYFSPYSGAYWLVTEFDGRDEMFGWAELHPGMGELGYMSLSELSRVRFHGAPAVERDLYFKPKPLSQAKAEERRNRGIDNDDARTASDIPDGILAEMIKFTEGCPDNLDESECKEWESNTDKYKDVVKDQHQAASDILQAIHRGDRVTITNRFGQESTGTAVMKGPAGWVLNMGGAHGTPAIASDENIVKVRPAKRGSEEVAASEIDIEAAWDANLTKTAGSSSIKEGDHVHIDEGYNGKGPHTGIVVKPGNTFGHPPKPDDVFVKIDGDGGIFRAKKYNLTKTAAMEPTGLYGYTRAIQSSCEASIRKMARAASRIAKEAYKKDESVAPFLAAHAKRSNSLPARILVEAMREIGPKIASDMRLAELKVASLPADKLTKEAARKFGLYGYPAKTASLGLQSCMALREHAGAVVADLHGRKADAHEHITGFFKAHAKEAKCMYSKMLCASYPDADRRTASLIAPTTVEGWLNWEE
jgi:hypothetical protein